MGIEQLQAYLARTHPRGAAVSHPVRLLDTARGKLHELLRRRAELFVSYATGR